MARWAVTLSHNPVLDYGRFVAFATARLIFHKELDHDSPVIPVYLLGQGERARVL